MKSKSYLFLVCLIFSLNAAHAVKETETIADYYETYKGYRKLYQKNHGLSEKTEAELLAGFEKMLREEIQHAATYGLKKVSISFDDYGQARGSFDRINADAVLKDFERYSKMILEAELKEKLKNEDNKNQ